NMIAHRATLAAYVRRRHRIGAGAVRAAYREIRAVPLTTAPAGRRLAWVAIAGIAGVILASIGVPRLGVRFDQLGALSDRLGERFDVASWTSATASTPADASFTVAAATPAEAPQAIPVATAPAPAPASAPAPAAAPVQSADD